MTSATTTPLPVGPSHSKNNIALNSRRQPNTNTNAHTLSLHQRFVKIVKLVATRNNGQLPKELRQADRSGNLALGIHGVNDHDDRPPHFRCHVCGIGFICTDYQVARHIVTKKHTDAFVEWALLIKQEYPEDEECETDSDTEDRNSSESGDEDSSSDDEEVENPFQGLKQRLRLGTTAEAFDKSNYAQYRFAVAASRVKKQEHELKRKYLKIDPTSKYTLGFYAKDEHTIFCHVCKRSFAGRFLLLDPLLGHIRSKKHLKSFSDFVNKVEGRDDDDDDISEEDDDEENDTVVTPKRSSRNRRTATANNNNSVLLKISDSSNKKYFNNDEEIGLSLEKKESKRQQLGMNYFSNLISAIMTSSKTTPPADFVDRLPRVRSSLKLPFRRQRDEEETTSDDEDDDDDEEEEESDDEDDDEISTIDAKELAGNGNDDAAVKKEEDDSDSKEEQFLNNVSKSIIDDEEELTVVNSSSSPRRGRKQPRIVNLRSPGKKNNKDDNSNNSETNSFNENNIKSDLEKLPVLAFDRKSRLTKEAATELFSNRDNNPKLEVIEEQESIRLSKMKGRTLYCLCEYMIVDLEEQCGLKRLVEIPNLEDDLDPANKHLNKSSELRKLIQGKRACFHQEDSLSFVVGNVVDVSCSRTRDVVERNVQIAPSSQFEDPDPLADRKLRWVDLEKLHVLPSKPKSKEQEEKATTKVTEDGHADKINGDDEEEEEEEEEEEDIEFLVEEVAKIRAQVRKFASLTQTQE